MKLLLFVLLTAIVCSTSAMKLHNSHLPSVGNYGIPLIVIYLCIINFFIYPVFAFDISNHFAIIAVHGLWSDWQQWGSCSATCGVGHSTRTRQCKHLKPRYGGDDCDRSGSINAEYRICRRPECIGEKPYYHYL